MPWIVIMRHVSVLAQATCSALSVIGAFTQNELKKMDVRSSMN